MQVIDSMVYVSKQQHNTCHCLTGIIIQAAGEESNAVCFILAVHGHLKHFLYQKKKTKKQIFLKFWFILATS